MSSFSYICFLETMSVKDLAIVGGKNASLGEMISSFKEKKIPVPEGFATTSLGYWKFIEENKLQEKISSILLQLQKEKLSLKKAGKKLRKLFLKAHFPRKLEEEILRAYEELSLRYGNENVDVAVRSSATAEDLPDASFAGQQESFLNVKGKKELLAACKKCYASLFTDRAIRYREEKGFSHLKVALSIGVQKMIRSDRAGAGVMFTIDTESGFPKVIVINAAWGLGENVVQGTIEPDEYRVFKPLLQEKNLSPIIEKNLGKKEKKMVYSWRGTKNCHTSPKEQDSFVLSDEEILKLSRFALLIEEHYGKPMDIEWAKDGNSGALFIVQARPETVKSQQKKSFVKSYCLKQQGNVRIKGLAIGEAISSGKVQVIFNVKDIGLFQKGSILVTEMTTPDWVPIMTQAKGIITDHGGRTSHAAIVSRELGVPAIVGTENATKLLKDGQEITLCCAEGETGVVYEGILPFKEEHIDLDSLPKISTPILMNISSPESAFRWWQLPCQGIGLARMEFLLSNTIQIHPMALIDFEKLKDKNAKKKIEKLTQGFPSKEEYFLNHLSRGIARIAASQYPKEVIVRMSDFKTNEYAGLIGGAEFEPKEENPMLGFRGASRYYNPRYRKGFDLECKALKRTREEMGFSNIIVMIPFCRTLEEADKVLEVLAENGLKKGSHNLKIYVMCEIPSNVILADEFSDRFDGFSIGSNDLTQLVLGIDRDSQELAPLFDAKNEAIKRLIHQLIQAAHKKNRKVGICGQAPSDSPEFARFLIKEGIDSISLNPDSVVPVLRKLGGK